MASSPAQSPSTPRRIVVNRSFTTPSRFSTATNPPAEVGSAEDGETLYTHPSANIVKFITSSRPGSSSPGGPSSSSGTLPWRTLTERTVAAGPLEIYRVPGSVSFLHSGELLHPILPRSQCWCVDGVSKFVMRAMIDTYFRIELPEDDLGEVEKMKATLRTVLHYERTPCPFARGFEVALPADEVEVKKRRRRSAGPAKRWRLDRAYSWKPEGWVEPEGRGSGDEGEGSEEGSEDEEEAQEESGGEKTPAERVEAAELADEVKELHVESPSRSRGPAGLRSITAPPQLTLQSTPPSRLRTRVDVNGTVEVSEPVADGESSGQDAPRLRTFQAIPTDMPPSPPDSSAGMEGVEDRGQSEGGAVEERTVGVEDVTVGEAEVGTDDAVNEEAQDGRQQPDFDVSTGDSDVDGMEDTTERPCSSTEDSDKESIAHSQAATEIPSTDSPANPTQEHQPNAETSTSTSRPTTPPNQPTTEDPYAAIQARILARRSIGGTTSFYPNRTSPTRQSSSSTSSTATLASRHSSHSRQHQQAFATALVKKACAVFLGPPAHLVAMMLRIAARFASGAFGVDGVFYVASEGAGDGVLPGSCWVGDGEEVEVVEGDGDEDDFGVPLRSPVRLAARREGVGDGDGVRERRGWEVD